MKLLAILLLLFLLVLLLLASDQPTQRLSLSPNSPHSPDSSSSWPFVQIAQLQLLVLAHDLQLIRPTSFRIEKFNFTINNREEKEEEKT